jgi:hypothetical protein
VPEIRTAQDRVFYTGMAVAAAAAVLLGFSRTYYLRPYFQDQSLPPYLHLHGAVFSAWIVLLVSQTSLVAARRTDLHRRLGWAGAVLAVAMVAVALTAAIVSGRREIAAGNETGELAFLTTPLSSMVVFFALVAAAVRFRRQTETHKRLMLLATINILDAATARWPLAIVATTSWGGYAIVDLFIVIAVAYDFATRRRVHPAYLWGALLIVGSQVLREPIGHSAAWQPVARMILE